MTTKPVTGQWPVLCKKDGAKAAFVWRMVNTPKQERRAA